MISHRARARLRYWRSCLRRNIPPGLRTVLGLLCVLLGIVGFLPIVGFWMIPLGVGLIWLDIAALLNRTKRR